MTMEYSDIEWVSYSVSGATLADVVAAVSAQPEAGSAEWHPDYSYEADDSGTVTDATVHIGWKITMPQWDGYDSATDSQKAEWDRFWSALETHERGHLDLVDQYLRDIDQQMIGQPVAAAQKVWSDALTSLQSGSDSYDSQNDHGRNQGTNIDVDA